MQESLTTFDVPLGEVFPVEEVDIRFDPAPHQFELRNLDSIEANWVAEKAANPAYFDGTVVMHSTLSYRRGRLWGVCHPIRFATYLWWRRTVPDRSAENTFAHAMIVSSDGHLVAIRMGGHTANAGAVYFAAGSFEPQDFPDGQVDLHGNMRREVLEETGLDLDEAEAEPVWHAVASLVGTVIFRRYRFDRTAEQLAAAISSFVAGDPDPEIVGPVIIRRGETLPDTLKAHMVPIIRWHFGE